MIRYTTGNLLDAPVEALVNTVNTVGVMGKGIALMFKERFPDNMAAYREACKEGRVQTGKMFVTETNEFLAPRWIVNFPTKQHWKAKSQIEWVEDGLQDLKHQFEQIVQQYTGKQPQDEISFPYITYAYHFQKILCTRQK